MGRRTFAAVLSVVVMIGLLVGLAPGAAQAVQSPQDLLVSDDPVDFTPHVLDGEVLAVAVVGDTVVLGGAFTRVQSAAGGPEILRTNILAFDRTTGVIDTAFVPTVNKKVRTLAPAADGQSVFVGGQFSVVNGQTAHKVVRLDIDTGQQVSGFNAGLIDANVEDLKLVGDRLFIAGHFVQVQFQTRKLFAELDPDTGALRPSTADFEGVFTNGVSFIRKFDVNPDGTTLVAVGNFMTVNAQPRRQIAMLDVTGAPTLAADWRSIRLEPVCKTTFGYYVRDVDFSPDGSHFVVATTGSAGPGIPTLCDSASRWTADDRGQAVNPTWVDYTGGDSAYSVALTGTASYIGGHMRWFNNPYGVDFAGAGAVEREGIAALDPVNGVPLTWNPGRTRGRAVFDMVATPDGLWVGSDTDRIGGFEYHGRIAFFPLAGGTEVPQRVTPPLPVAAHIVMPPTVPPSPIVAREFDGGTASATAAAPAGAIDWTRVRGGFWLDGALYLATTAGLTVQSFDGTSYGAATTLNLNGLTQFQTEMSSMIGLFYENGSIFFTLSGDANLYQRYFSVESGIVGGQRFTVASGGVNWSQTDGMFFADGAVYWSASASGDLHRTSWAANAPVTGTDTIVSGPGSDGQDWRGAAMFALSGTPPNQPPTVSFDVACVAMTCDFDGTASGDTDGAIVSYEWSFGDGDVGSGDQVTHAFAGFGAYTVTLTVTDDTGDTATISQGLVLEESAVEFVGSGVDDKSVSSNAHGVVVPPGVQSGDVMVMSLVYNSGTDTASDPVGWVRADEAGTNKVRTVLWTRTATAADAGSTVSVTTSTFVKAALLLGVYRGAEVAAGDLDVVGETVNRASHTTPTLTAPAGSWVVSMWADKTAATTSWASPAGQQVRETGAGTGGGHVSWLYTDGAGGVPAGGVGGLVATANSSTAQATMATVVLAPAG